MSCVITMMLVRMFDRLTSPDGPKLNLALELITVISPSIPLADSPGDPPLVGWVSDVLLV